MAARFAECRCESNFTCGHCLRNAKPYHYTLSNGSAIYDCPVDLNPPRRYKAEETT